MYVRLYAPGAPAGARRRLDLDGDIVEVIGDGPARLVAGAGRPRSLDVVDVGSRALEDISLEHSMLVYGDRFRPSDLRQLQEQALCGIDRAGQLVVSTPDLALVVGRPKADYPSLPREATVAQVKGHQLAGASPGVRGATTARLTQLLIEEPSRIWQPTVLAELDGKAAVATASRLLADLASLGLLATVTRDRSHQYRIVDVNMLGQWLAQRSRPPTPAETLTCYVRAPSAQELVTRLADVVRRLPYKAVLTGAAAALLEGVPATTSLSLAQVRVEPGRSLKVAREEMGATPAPAGNNVRLISDVGLVGTLHPRSIRGTPAAGVVRTWLDLRSETRGADAAELYWDQGVLRAGSDAR